MKIVKKKKRKEILKGTDEFVSAIDRIINFVITNYKISCFIGVCFVLAVIIFIGVRSYKVRGVNRLLKEESTLDKKFFDTVLVEKPNEKKEALIKLSKQYEGIANKPLINKHIVYFNAGNLYYELNQYGKAKESYKRVLRCLHNKKNWLVAAAYLGIAYCYECTKNYTLALEHYQNAKNLDNGLFSDDIRLGIARCYEKLSKISEAKEIYNAILEKESNSIWGKEASVRIEFLDRSE